MQYSTASSQEKKRVPTTRNSDILALIRILKSAYTMSVQRLADELTFCVHLVSWEKENVTSTALETTRFTCNKYVAHFAGKNAFHQDILAICIHSIGMCCQIQFPFFYIGAWWRVSWVCTAICCAFFGWCNPNTDSARLSMAFICADEIGGFLLFAEVEVFKEIGA
jgi:hypothetical protein